MAGKHNNAKRKGLGSGLGRQSQASINYSKVQYKKQIHGKAVTLQK